MRKQTKNFTILTMKDVRGGLLRNTEIFIGVPLSLFHLVSYSVSGFPIGKHKTDNEGRVFLSGLNDAQAVIFRVDRVIFPAYIQLGVVQEIRIPPKKFQFKPLIIDL